MENLNNLNYFLGANTCVGFYSHFDELANNPDDFLWIIKGGPGNGKSGFMKKIAIAANKAGYAVEFAYCSGDPNSLDGIYFPELKTGYVDGTSPHVADAKIAACNSAYIDLGAFYDIAKIKPQKDALEHYFTKNKECYERAYAFLKAAGSVKRISIENSLPDAVKRRINGLSNSNFKKKRNSNAHVKRLFLTAHTCDGITMFSKTLSTLCNKIQVIDSSLGYAPTALEDLSKSAIAAGFDIIICDDPLIPEIPEAVIVPKLSLAFINSTSPLSMVEPSKKIRLDIYADNHELHRKKGENRKFSKIYNALLNEAYLSLSEAKSNHDELEKIYNPYVNFDGVYALAEEHLSMLLY
mgnify:CR=1 FL=1